MALPSSGPISLSQVNVELGLSTTAQISLNDAAVRNLFGKPTGTISLSDGYGKSNEFAFTITANQTNANLRTLAVNAGWNQLSKVVATINSGVYISSNVTGTPALTVNGSFPNGVQLVNNGFIVGRGGNGGQGGGFNGSTPSGGSAGAGGGLALSVAVALTLNNAGTIAGGGGGGGGGQSNYFSSSSGNTGSSSVSKGDQGQGGGGGGGGRSSLINSSGGTGGTAVNHSTSSPGQAGNAGTVNDPGIGSAGGVNGSQIGGTGGSGGQWGASGATGGNASGSFTSRHGSFAGGAGGAAISGNANISYIATGTRLGAIS
jgi:hypothetical protein